jgi:hypothetical protein
VTEQCTKVHASAKTVYYIGLDGGSLKSGSVVQNEAPRYKPEGRGFHFHWCYGNLLLTETFQHQYESWVDSNSNINEYQGYLLGQKAAGA